MSHHLPHGAGKGRDRGADPGQPLRGVQAATEKERRDAGADPRGDAAVSDPSEGGRLLRTGPAGAVNGDEAGRDLRAQVERPQFQDRRPAHRAAGHPCGRRASNLQAQDEKLRQNGDPAPGCGERAQSPTGAHRLRVAVPIHPPPRPHRPAERLPQNEKGP